MPPPHFPSVRGGSEATSSTEADELPPSPPLIQARKCATSQHIDAISRAKTRKIRVRRIDRRSLVRLAILPEGQQPPVKACFSQQPASFFSRSDDSAVACFFSPLSAVATAVAVDRAAICGTQRASPAMRISPPAKVLELTFRLPTDRSEKYHADRCHSRRAGIAGLGSPRMEPGCCIDLACPCSWPEPHEHERHSNCGFLQ